MLKEISPAFNIVSSVTLSATTYTSSASAFHYKDSLSYQVTWSGLVVGTININGSIDYNPGYPQTGQSNAGNWTTITDQTIGSGTAQPVLFNLNQIACPYTQIQFVITSGTGTFNTWLFAKSLG